MASYESALQGIISIIRTNSLTFEDLFPLISYSSSFRISELQIYERLVCDLLQVFSNETFKLNVSPNDFFFSYISSKIPQLESDEDGFIYSIKHDFFSLEDSFLALLESDDTEFLTTILQETVKTNFIIKILTACALYGSCRCFKIAFSYCPQRSYQTIANYAYMGGNAEIIQFVQEFCYDIDKTLCEKFALRAHNYRYISDTTTFDFKTVVSSFATAYLSHTSPTNLNQVTQINSKTVLLFHFIATSRGIQYIIDNHLEEDFITACIKMDKEMALNISVPDMQTDFKFIWESNSCYANSVLKMLFDLVEIRNADFLTDDEPTLCDYQLAIIQYYIKTGKNQITTEYFRFFTARETNFVFGTQNDAAEQFLYIYQNSSTVHRLFNIKQEQDYFTFFLTSSFLQHDLVSKKIISEGMLYLNKKKEIDEVSVSNLGLHPIYNSLQFGTYISCSHILSLSPYIIICSQKGSYSRKPINFTIAGVYLHFIGAISFKNHHYKYIEKINGLFTEFDDLHPSENAPIVNGLEQYHFTMMLYKVQNPKDLQTQLNLQSTIATNLSEIDQNAETFKVYDIIATNLGLFRDYSNSHEEMRWNFIFESANLNNIPDFHELLSAFQKAASDAKQIWTNIKTTITLAKKQKMPFVQSMKKSNAIKIIPNHSIQNSLHRKCLESKKQSIEAKEKPKEDGAKQHEPSEGIKCKSKENKPFGFEELKTKEPAKYYKKLCAHFKALYANQTRITKTYQKKFEDSQRQITSIERNPLKFFNELTKMLFTMTARNKNKPSQAHFFTPEEKDKCLGIYLYSKTLYNAYKQEQGWILPSNTNMVKYRQQFLSKFNFAAFKSREDSDFIDVVEKWIQIMPDKKPAVILAIDAMCVTTRIEMRADGIIGVIPENQMKNEHTIFMKNCDSFDQVLDVIFKNDYNAQAIFVTQLIPLSNDRPYIVHYEMANTGSASKEIYETLMHEIKIISEHFTDNFHCYGGASDGDPQYQKAFNIFTQEWFNDIKEAPLQLHNIIKNLNSAKCFSPDISHLGKRMKYRSQNEIVKKLVCSKEEITYQQLIEFFKADVTWSEFNNDSWTKMNDDAVHDFFTPRHLTEILTKKEFKYIELFMPGVILNVMFYDQRIDRAQRIFVALIGFYFGFYLHLTMKNPEFSSPNLLWTKEQVQDFLNCTIQAIKILSEVEGSFSMSRLGTLNNEHLFSTTRRITYGDQSSIASENALQKIIALRSIDNESISKKSHSRYPPAIVEPTPYKPTEFDVDAANCIAQSLLIQCEGIEIIPEKYRSDQKDEGKEAYETFLEILSFWDDHYSYPNHHTTNHTSIDGHRGSSQILHRFIGNFQAKKSYKAKKKDK